MIEIEPPQFIERGRHVAAGVVEVHGLEHGRQFAWAHAAVDTFCPPHGRRDRIRGLVDLVTIEIEIVLVEDLGAAGNVGAADRVGSIVGAWCRGRGAHGAGLLFEIKTYRPARRCTQALSPRFYFAVRSATRRRNDGGPWLLRAVTARTDNPASR